MLQRLSCYCCCCCLEAKSCLTVTPWTAALQACPSFTSSQSLLKCMFISSSIVFFSPCHQSFWASGFFPVSQLFASGGWSIGASASVISLSSDYLGLISFRIDWLDLLAVQWTLKSLPQHHNSKASILWCSAFFMVQLSHLYMTTGKTMCVSYSLLSDSFATSWTVAHQASLSIGFSGKNTRVGCHFLFQGTFVTQGSSPSLSHCKQILYCLSHREP